jgi:hypothetical protein
MISELVKRPETDILSALEEKCRESSLIEDFDEDPRVENALLCLLQGEIDFSQGFAGQLKRVEYLDDQWVASYLLWRTGRYDMCRGIRSGMLSLYDPFKSNNPVVKVLAYCENLEESLSLSELDWTVESMRHYLGLSDDPLVRRCYPVLEHVAEMKRDDIISFEGDSDEKAA